MDTSTTTKLAGEKDSRAIGLVVRASSEQQDVARQLEQVPAYAASKYPGRETIAFYDEDDATTTKASATKASIFDRLPDLIAAIEAGRIGTVLADEQSRLVRGQSAVEWASFHALCSDHGVTIETIYQGIIQPEDEAAEIMGLLRNVQDRAEIKKLRHRITSAKKERVSNGYWPWASAPTGYDKQRDERAKRAILVKNDHAAAVLQAFQDFADFTPDAEVCRTLGEAIGRKVSRMMLRKILTNRAYLGMIRHKDTWHQGRHDPIVSESLYKKVQARLEGRKEHRYYAARTQPFAHIIRCAACGKPMRYQHIHKRGRDFTYFACESDYDSQFQTGRSVCAVTKKRQAIPAASVEATVALHATAIGFGLQKMLDDDPTYGIPASAERPVQIIRAELSQAKAEAKRLGKLVALEMLDEYDAQVQSALREKQALEAELDRAMNEAKSHREELADLRDTLLGPWNEYWNSLSHDALHQHKAAMDEDGDSAVLALIIAWSRADDATKEAIASKTLRAIAVHTDKGLALHFRAGLPQKIIAHHEAPADRRKDSHGVIEKLETLGFGYYGDLRERVSERELAL